jgi:hypothetical protein
MQSPWRSGPSNWTRRTRTRWVRSPRTRRACVSSRASLPAWSATVPTPRHPNCPSSYVAVSPFVLSPY